MKHEKTSNKNRLFSAFADGGDSVSINPMQKYSTYDQDSVHASREDVLQYVPPSNAKSNRLHENVDPEANFSTTVSGHMNAPSPAVYFKCPDDLLPFHELRLYTRLSDKDLRYHAGR